jgi:hypothetical protein
MEMRGKQPDCDGGRAVAAMCSLAARNRHFGEIAIVTV